MVRSINRILNPLHMYIINIYLFNVDNECFSVFKQPCCLLEFNFMLQFVVQYRRLSFNTDANVFFLQIHNYIAWSQLECCLRWNFKLWEKNTQHIKKRNPQLFIMWSICSIWCILKYHFRHQIKQYVSRLLYRTHTSYSKY